MTRRVRPEVADHAAMVATIVDAYSVASAADRAAGADWYPTAGRMVAAIADSAGLPQHRVAFALAALSPRNPWRWNVADAYVYAHAFAAGAEVIPAATTFGANQRAAWRALDGRVNPWIGAADKVSAFVAAILGDHDRVVVDVWAIRVATGGALDRVLPGEYALVASAYQDAAVIVGASPSTVQAVTWIAAQRAGLGSNRRGDHAATFKRGTPPAVVALFTSATV